MARPASPAPGSTNDETFDLTEAMNAGALGERGRFAYSNLGFALAWMGSLAILTWWAILRR